MKTLEELINTTEPAIDLIREWAATAATTCEILPPTPQREQTLLDLQITTRSPLGALAYETGGILIDHGWLSFWGSGGGRLPINVAEFNYDHEGCLVIAHDAAGGFFALNTGAFPGETGEVHYLAPDTLNWEPLGRGYTDILHAFITTDLADFFAGLRWENWQSEVASLAPGTCFNAYPPLWTKDGQASSIRKPLSVSEAFHFQMDVIRQLHAQSSN